MFKDRQDAGQQLAKALKKYKDEKPLVLAIPRGGVAVGHAVANRLESEFSILIARKLPFPHNPEAGFGAIAEDGGYHVIEGMKVFIAEEEVSRIIEEQKQEIERRQEILRKGKPLPTIKGRTVILVDDGIATGATMLVAVKMCQKQEAGKIVVAVPVAGQDRIREFKKRVDELVVLESPASFRAVAQVYENWYDVPDDEVLAILYGEGSS